MIVTEPLLKSKDSRLAQTTGILAAKPLAELSDGPAAQAEPILLIHGTFANQRRDTPDWWHPGSEFCRELDAALAAAKSPARCWSHLKSTRGCHTPFAWTGENSERDRVRAGQALAQQLSAFECDGKVSRYHLIAHSHGGNVLLQALRSLEAPPRKSGAVVFMGTPVLHFRHPRPWDLARFSILIYLLLVAACIWAMAHWHHNSYLIGFLAVTVSALVAECFWFKRSVTTPEDRLYGTGQPTAFVLDQDEAIDSLILAEAVIRESREFVRQFTDPHFASPPIAAADIVRASGKTSPAFPPIDSETVTLLEMIHRNGAFRILRWFETFEPASSRLISPAFEGSAPEPYLPFPAPGLPKVEQPGMNVARSVFGVLSTSMAGYPWLILKLFLLTCATLPILVMFTVRLAFAILLAVGGGVARCFAKFMLWISPWVISKVIKKAAFGADQGTLLNVARLPPGVAYRARMPDTTVNQAAAISQRLGHEFGFALVKSIVKQDAFAIKSQVMYSLSRTDIVHSLYYQDEGIRSEIVKCLLKPEPPPLDFSPSYWQSRSIGDKSLGRKKAQKAQDD